MQPVLAEAVSVEFETMKTFTEPKEFVDDTQKQGFGCLFFTVR